MPVVPRFSKKKSYLTADEIRGLIGRQLKEKEVREDPLHRRAAHEAEPQGAVMHAFWASATRGPDAKLAATGKLTPTNGLGLASLLELGAIVYLWTYHTEFENLDVESSPEGGCLSPPHGGCLSSPQGGCLSPPGGGCLKLVDAKAVLPESQFVGMLRNDWPWGNISDVVRFRGAFLFNRLGNPAWIIDLDTIWLRSPCAALCPSVSGHIFATQAARQRVHGDAQYWKTRYLRVPEERSYAVPPFFFPSRSCVLEAAQESLYTQGASNVVSSG